MKRGRPTDEGRSLPLNAAVFALAAGLLGCALQRDSGFYSEIALVWLTAALCFTAFGVLGNVPAQRLVISRRVLENLLAGGAALQLLLLLLKPPGAYLQIADPAGLSPFRLGIAAAGAVLLTGRFRSRVLGRMWFPMLLTIHFALGVWLIKASPDPAIDVVTVHREAIAALANGRNPYAITFANIYGPDTTFYAPELFAGDRVQFGLPYPPLSLLLVSPAELLLGDYRYANLVAMTIAGGAIGYSAPTAVARLAATVFLFTPRIFFVLEQGWTEPLVVMLLAVTVFCALNAQRWTPLALGGLVAVKQYLVFAFPLSLLLIPRPWWPRSLSVLWRVAAVGAVVTIPFVMWNPPAFFRSVVTLQIYEPFRIDSLSYSSLVARNLSITPPAWASILPAGVAVGLVLWRARRTPSGFAAGLAFVTFVVFAFGKKAFCNYYFFVIGALCCASAALTHAGDSNRDATGRSRSALPSRTSQKIESRSPAAGS